MTRIGLAGLLACIALAGLWACQPIWPPATPTPPAPPTSPGQPTVTPAPADFLYLGAYGVAPAALPRAAAAGVRVVAMPPAELQATLAYMDAAHALGLRVRVSLSPSFLNAKEEDIAAYLGPLASHPALQLWYLPEEPKSASDHGRWKRLYELVKKHDAGRHPIGVYLAEGATEEYFAGWTDICDLIFAGAYPEYYRIPRAALYTRVHNAGLAAQRAGKGVIAVPQFFDAEAFQDGDTAGTYAGHPDATAVRADAYTALIAGASGIDWYSLEYALPYPDMLAAWEGAIAELRTLEPALLHPLAEAPFAWRITRGPQSVPSFGRVREPALAARAYEDEAARYLLAVNLADEELEAVFQGVPASQTRLTVVFEEREIELRDGSWSDVFAPHQVHVYRILQEQKP
ncbi:MAG: hypothetical protein H5T60_06450 [Anaerolineae bacterium]|nr:hypothetical protein [Anaerolineae bacterium]